MIVYIKGYAATDDNIEFCPYCGEEKPEIPEDCVISCHGCGREYAVIYAENTMGRWACKRVKGIPPEHL